MAAAYLEVDMGALLRLAELVELQARGDLTLLAEIRQLEDRFGLTPKSRQLLQWQVLSVGEAGSPPVSSSPASAASVRRLRAVDPQAAAG
jgi:hypothetical protein